MLFSSSANMRPNMLNWTRTERRCVLGELSSSSFFLATQNADVWDVRTDEVWKPQWQLQRLFSLRSSSRRPEVPCSVPALHGSFVQLLACVRAPQFSKDTESPETHVQAWTSVPECRVDCLILFWNLLQVGGSELRLSTSSLTLRLAECSVRPPVVPEMPVLTKLQDERHLNLLNMY